MLESSIRLPKVVPWLLFRFMKRSGEVEEERNVGGQESCSTLALWSSELQSPGPSKVNLTSVR